MADNSQFFHRRRRDLLAPPINPCGRLSSHLDKSLSVAFATVFFVALAYLVLNSIQQCIRRRRRLNHLEGQQPAARVADENPERDCTAQLASMPVQAYSAGSASCSVGGGPDSCSVCLAEYADGEEVRVMLACGHMFHRECIDRWLTTRSSFCPICRHRVIERAVEPVGTSCTNNNNDGNNRDGMVRLNILVASSQTHLMKAVVHGSSRLNGKQQTPLVLEKLNPFTERHLRQHRHGKNVDGTRTILP